jgi:hypothetical protein
MRLLTRWTFAAVALTVAGSVRGQDYKPPEVMMPSDEVAKQIAEKGQRLAHLLTLLRKQGVNDRLLVDVEIYLQAAQAAVKHREFYGKASGEWTLAVLDRGMLRANFLASGDTPWLFTSGQTVARGYRSRIDGTVQPFAVTYPIDFGKDAKKQWRIDVELHGRDNSLTEVKFLHAHNGERAVPKEQDFVKINIYGRGNNAYRWAGETDVFEAINTYLEAEKIAGRGQLSDSGRVVLRGFSMGGAGTWHLGLHWPDRWCVIGPGAGFTTTHGYATKLPNRLPPYQEACLHIYDAVDYALNAEDVPVVAYSGAKDPQKQAADNIEAALKKHKVTIDHLVAPDLSHTFPPEWFNKANQLYTKYADEPRPKYPPTINFTTWTLKYPECHWVYILGMDKHYEKAHILAMHREADGGYNVATRNVRDLRINVADFTGQVQQIAIDDQKVEAKPFLREGGLYSVYLQKRAGKWVAVLPQRLVTQQAHRPRKVHKLQGPIDDAFTEPFLCVRGTGKGWHEAPRQVADARLKRFAEEWSKYWRGELPVKDDTDVTPTDIAGRHLILFGDPASNSLIAEVLDGLPLEWTRDEIRMAGYKVGAAKHLPVLIYPNPLNPERYIVLNSGHTFPTSAYTETNAMLFPRLGDYALLRTGEDPLAVDVVTAGLFDDEWMPDRK